MGEGLGSSNGLSKVIKGVELKVQGPSPGKEKYTNICHSKKKGMGENYQPREINR